MVLENLQLQATILINNLSYESALRSFSLVSFWLWNFLTQKARIKCWWNWQQGSISSTFYKQPTYPKSVKRYWWINCNFTLSGSTSTKGARKMLMKLTPGSRSPRRWWCWRRREGSTCSLARSRRAQSFYQPCHVQTRKLNCWSQGIHRQPFSNVKENQEGLIPVFLNLFWFTLFD